MSELDRLYDQVDQALSDHRFDKDFSLGSRIALELAELLPDLDAKQRSALGLSRKFWSGEAVEIERVNCLRILWDQDDRGIGPPRRAAAHRLVISSLTNTSGLDAFAGEFIIGIASDAGLSPDQIRSVFQRHLAISA